MTTFEGESNKEKKSTKRVMIEGMQQMVHHLMCRGHWLSKFR